MNKEQFNKLNIEQQVEHINKSLKNTSLTKVCEGIGIDRATVRKRFKSKGYILQENKYVKLLDNNITTNNTKTTIKAKKNKQSNNTNTLEERLSQLELELESIKSILTTITTSNTNIKTTDTTITTDIKTYDKNTLVVRTYKVNNEVQQAFKQFCRQNSNYKVSDLVTNALEEYMDKFK